MKNTPLVVLECPPGNEYLTNQNRRTTAPEAPFTSDKKTNKQTHV